MTTYPNSKRARAKPKYEWDAARIRALREELGMTQTQMSEEIGVRQQTVSEWECGMYRPRGASAKLLNLLAERAGFQYRAKGE